MCGFGWGMVAPFAAIFVVWLIVVRPEQWPASPSEWQSGAAWLAALTQVLSQVLLVSVLFAIGRGIGGACHIGTVSVDPLLAPLGVLHRDPALPDAVGRARGGQSGRLPG